MLRVCDNSACNKLIYGLSLFSCSTVRFLSFIFVLLYSTDVAINVL